MIPATEWLFPNGVLVDRDYDGLKSDPEYGINVSTKGMKALEPFRFDAILDRIFGDAVTEGA